MTRQPEQNLSVDSPADSSRDERATKESRPKRFRFNFIRSKRWRVILLVLLVFVFTSQVPFVYRRYELTRLRAQIEDLKNRRIVRAAEDDYNDYRGVVHVHSSLGGHSTGDFREIIEAARANDLHFVVMTEHTEREFDTAAMTLNNRHGGTLFVGGSEVAAVSGERLLLIPGGPSIGNASLSARDVLSGERTGGQLRFVAYPEQFRSWETDGYDGIEIYNLYTNARAINFPLMFFDGLWSYGSYSDLLFARFYARPEASLRWWDELTASTGRRIVAIAGVDAHSNVGLRIGDRSGNDLLGVQLDPYERSFRIVRTHALVERDGELNREALLAAFERGHCYFAFDIFADATGFRFFAENGNERRILGDEIMLNDGVGLSVLTPLESRIVLFKDGRVLTEVRDTAQHKFTIQHAGVYRVEVYLDWLELIGGEPWIVSNPIYVR